MDSAIRHQPKGHREHGFYTALWPFSHAASSQWLRSQSLRYGLRTIIRHKGRSRLIVLMVHSDLLALMVHSRLLVLMVHPRLLALMVHPRPIVLMVRSRLIVLMVHSHLLFLMVFHSRPIVLMMSRRRCFRCYENSTVIRI